MSLQVEAFLDRGSIQFQEKIFESNNNLNNSDSLALTDSKEFLNTYYALFFSAIEEIVLEEDELLETEINFIEEKTPLGTAGSLRYLKGKFKSDFFVRSEISIFNSWQIFKSKSASIFLFPPSIKVR